MSTASAAPPVWTAWLGTIPYGEALALQKALEGARQRGEIPDVLLLLEHPPVYTKGRRTESHHLPFGEEWYRQRGIEIHETDRGGQVTYHGPGQVVAYGLIDLRRAGLFVRTYVERMEDAVIDTLAAFGIAGACRKPGAPGVYVPESGDLAKIAALGIKVRNGCAYHGVALNVAMDLKPFAGINPCGYAGLRTVDMASCGVAADLVEVGEALARNLVRRCGLGQG